MFVFFSLEMFRDTSLSQSKLISIKQTLIFVSQLHLFALGPYVRKMCQFGPCAKLSDYDQLCGRVAEQYHLSGFYRAFMSASNQWLVNLFADVCISAKIVNIRVCFQG